ncbi:MAG: hypothetical protein QNJ32_14975 [Xenococcaceae cyanobacterium MO_167.B27]|nr:hypothetical protein [Xenococcaceae cyanobacterium MO_167.B27]
MLNNFTVQRDSKQILIIDMLKLQDNPQKLMSSLDEFLALFYGDRTFKIQPDLTSTESRILPLPLISDRSGVLL